MLIESACIKKVFMHLVKFIKYIPNQIIAFNTDPIWKDYALKKLKLIENCDPRIGIFHYKSRFRRLDGDKLLLTDENKKTLITLAHDAIKFINEMA